jgi:hypothetical protein
MTSEVLFLGLLLLAAPAHAGARKPAPAAEDLLQEALALPAEAWSARVRVQAFDAAGKAKAQYRTVEFAPPSSWRIESSAKRGGAVAALMITDGKSAMTAWPTAGRAWLDRAAPEDRAAELTRLSSLYDLSVSTGGRVAGKAAWRLDLRSKADGRVRRSLWLGKTKGLLLRREDFRPDGRLLRRERATKFGEPPVAGPRFSPVVPAGLTASAVPRGAALPRWLPDGFVLDSAAGSEASFSDGLSVLVFHSGAAAVSAKPYAHVRLRSGAGRLYAEEDGIRLEWAVGGRSYSLFGDCAEADLARMADSVAEVP